MSNAYITDPDADAAAKSQREGRIALFVVLVVAIVTLLVSVIVTSNSLGETQDQVQTLTSQNKSLRAAHTACETSSRWYRQAIIDESDATTDWLNAWGSGDYTTTLDLSTAKADIAKAKAAGCSADTPTTNS